MKEGDSDDRPAIAEARLKLLVFDFDPARARFVRLCHPADQLVHAARSGPGTSCSIRGELAGMTRTGECAAVGCVIDAASEMRADGLQTADLRLLVNILVTNQPDAADGSRRVMSERVPPIGRDDHTHRTPHLGQSGQTGHPDKPGVPSAPPKGVEEEAQSGNGDAQAEKPGT